MGNCGGESQWSSIEIELEDRAEGFENLEDYINKRLTPDEDFIYPNKQGTWFLRNRTGVGLELGWAPSRDSLGGILGNQGMYSFMGGLTIGGAARFIMTTGHSVHVDVKGLTITFLVNEFHLESAEVRAKQTV
jgi:hypothetical protein